LISKWVLVDFWNAEIYFVVQGDIKGFAKNQFKCVCQEPVGLYEILDK
jgi:hypothetical protein